MAGQSTDSLWECVNLPGVQNQVQGSPGSPRVCGWSLLGCTAKALSRHPRAEEQFCSVLHSTAIRFCVHRTLAYLCGGQFLHLENKEKASFSLPRGVVPYTCQGSNGARLESWSTAALTLRGHRRRAQTGLYPEPACSARPSRDAIFSGKPS